MSEVPYSRLNSLLLFVSKAYDMKAHDILVQEVQYWSRAPKAAIEGK